MATLCCLIGLKNQVSWPLLGLTPAPPSLHRVVRLSACLRLVPVLPNSSPESLTWPGSLLETEASDCRVALLGSEPGLGLLRCGWATVQGKGR